MANPFDQFDDQIRMGEGIAVGGRVSPQTQAARDRAAAQLRADFEGGGDPTGLGDTVDQQVAKVAGTKPKEFPAATASNPFDRFDSASVQPVSDQQAASPPEQKTETGGIGDIPIPQFGNLTLNDIRQKSIFGLFEKTAKDVMARAQAINQLRTPDENGVSDVEREIVRRKQAGEPFDARSIEEWVDTRAREMVHGGPVQQTNPIEAGKQAITQAINNPLSTAKDSIEWMIAHPEVLALGPVGGIATIAGESALEQKVTTGGIDYGKLAAETGMNALPLMAVHGAVRIGNLRQAKAAGVPPNADVEARAMDVAASAAQTGAPLKEVVDRALASMDVPADQRVALAKGAEDAAAKGIEPQGDVAEYQGSSGQLQADRTNRNVAPEVQEEGYQASGGDSLQRGETQPGIPEGQVERRTNLAERARVAAMSPDEMRTALLTDPLSGLPNRRAYVEADKQPITASIDVDGLKWINDNLGHEAGDQLIKQVAGALKEHDAYHISGDEFVAQFPDRETARAAMEQFQNTLRNSKFEFITPDGERVTIDGPGATHGIGDTVSAADAALREGKVQKELSGERSQRGEPPPRLQRVQPTDVSGAGGGLAAGEQVQPNNPARVEAQRVMKRMRQERNAPPSQSIKVNIGTKGQRTIEFPREADKYVFQHGSRVEGMFRKSDLERQQARKAIEANRPYVAKALGVSEKLADNAARDYRQRVIDAARLMPEGSKLSAWAANKQSGKVDPKLLAAIGLAGVGATYGYWLNKDPADAVRGALVAGGLAAGVLALRKTFSAGRQVLNATADTRYRIDHLTDDFLGRVALARHAVYQVAEGVKAMVPRAAEREAMTHAIQSGDLSGLSPPAREAAVQVKRFFDEVGDRAQKAGIGLDNLLENYVTQLWVPGANSAKSLLENIKGIMAESRPRGPGMGTKTRFGMERTIPNYQEGMKAGLIPVTLDVAEIMRTYGDSVNRTIQNKHFIEALRRDMLPTGAPSLVRGDALEQVMQRQRDAIGGRELRDLSPRAAELESEIARIKSPRDYVTIDHPQMLGYRVHKDLEAPLRALFDAGNPTALERAAYAVSIAAKRSLFSFSLFHAKSLIDAMMGAGIKAAMGVPRALNELKFGSSDAVKDLIRGGLNVTRGPLESDANAFRNAARLIEAKAPFPISMPVRGLRWTQEHMDKFLWQTLHPSLKVATALATYERALTDPTFFQKIRAKTGFAPDWRGVPKEQIAKDVASYTNDLFGGIEWYRIADAVQNKYGRDLALGLASKRGRMLMQVMMLAPDWTVATARSMFKAIPGMSSPQLAALHRAYLLRQGLLYLTLYNGINQAFSGHNIWENKDPTMVDLGDGRRMQMAKHTMEPIHWLTKPFRQAANKLGQVPSEFYNQLAGTEYIGGPPMNTSVLGRLAHAGRKMLPIPSSVAAEQGVGPALSGFVGLPIYGKTEEQAVDAAVERALGVYRQKQEAGTPQRYRSEEQAAEAARRRTHKRYEKSRQEQANQ